jgi:hypothetical protein
MNNRQYVHPPLKKRGELDTWWSIHLVYGGRLVWRGRLVHGEGDLRLGRLIN